MTCLALTQENQNLCTIDLPSIAQNLQIIRKKLPPGAAIMSILKADGYGLGAVAMARFLEETGVEMCGVGFCSEGVELREAGITLPIFVLHANPWEAAQLVKYDLEPTFTDETLLEAISEEAVRQGKVISLHLNLDTGMKRLGCTPEQSLDLAKLAHRAPGVALAGVMTHFASADTPEDDPFTAEQFHKYTECLEAIEAAGIPIQWKHAANTSASIRRNLPGCNLYRIGIGMYGLGPTEAVMEALQLTPAVRITSTIVATHTLEAGETVSYNRTYRSPENGKKIAVLPLGYADGMQGPFVEFRGSRAQVVGKICMDFTLIDVSEWEEVKPGEEVVIFNKPLMIEIAEVKKLPIYQFLTNLGKRIPRRFVSR